MAPTASARCSRGRPDASPSSAAMKRLSHLQDRSVPVKIRGIPSRSGGPERAPRQAGQSPAEANRRDAGGYCPRGAKRRSGPGAYGTSERAEPPGAAGGVRASGRAGPGEGGDPGPPGSTAELPGGVAAQGRFRAGRRTADSRERATKSAARVRRQPQAGSRAGGRAAANRGRLKPSPHRAGERQAAGTRRRTGRRADRARIQRAGPRAGER